MGWWFLPRKGRLHSVGAFIKVRRDHFKHCPDAHTCQQQVSQVVLMSLVSGTKDSGGVSGEFRRGQCQLLKCLPFEQLDPQLGIL